MQTEYINQTMTCEDCQGAGFTEQEGKMVPCKKCWGSGAVIDSVIPEIIKKYVPAIDRSALPKITDEIFRHIAFKLNDTYKRGKLDGKAEQTIETKEEQSEA
jgi:hypothetical protein